MKTDVLSKASLDNAKSTTNEKPIGPSVESKSPPAFKKMEERIEHHGQTIKMTNDQYLRLTYVMDDILRQKH